MMKGPRPRIATTFAVVAFYINSDEVGKCLYLVVLGLR
jgi:hypothetical protein